MSMIKVIVRAVLAVYFGDSHSSIVQMGIAAVFGLFGLVTVAVLVLFLGAGLVGSLFNNVCCASWLVVVCCLLGRPAIAHTIISFMIDLRR